MIISFSERSWFVFTVLLLSRCFNAFTVNALLIGKMQVTVKLKQCKLKAKRWRCFFFTSRSSWWFVVKGNRTRTQKSVSVYHIAANLDSAQSCWREMSQICCLNSQNCQFVRWMRNTKRELCWYACIKCCFLLFVSDWSYKKCTLTKQENNRSEKQICSQDSNRLVRKVAGQVCWAWGACGSHSRPALSLSSLRSYSTACYFYIRGINHLKYV